MTLRVAYLQFMYNVEMFSVGTNAARFKPVRISTQKRGNE